MRTVRSDTAWYWIPHVDNSHKYSYCANKQNLSKIGESTWENNLRLPTAKNKLPSLIHYVETGQAINLTRHGKPVAVLLSIKHYKRLSCKRTGYWQALNSFRSQIVREGIFSESEDFENLRDPSSGPEVSDSSVKHGRYPLKIGLQKTMMKIADIDESEL